jgi:hypothetical protein
MRNEIGPSRRSSHEPGQATRQVGQRARFGRLITAFPIDIRRHIDFVSISHRCKMGRSSLRTLLAPTSLGRFQHFERVGSHRSGDADELGNIQPTFAAFVLGDDARAFRPKKPA